MSDDAGQRTARRRLAIAFAANLLMFVVGLAGWRLARSTALLGDALDMLADASGYAMAWLAVAGGARRRRAAVRWNGTMLMALGVGVAAEVVRRALAGAEPRGIAIVGFAGVSLLVNGLVLGVLAPFRHAAEPYLRATWIDTRADVLVNAGVLASGALVALTGARVIDLVAGALLAAFVMHEGWEILESAGDEASGAG